MGKKGERVGDSGEEKGEREWGIVGKKGREWGIVGKKGRAIIRVAKIIARSLKVSIFSESLCLVYPGTGVPVCMRHVVSCRG